MHLIRLIIAKTKLKNICYVLKYWINSIFGLVLLLIIICYYMQTNKNRMVLHSISWTIVGSGSGGQGVGRVGRGGGCISSGFSTAVFLGGERHPASGQLLSRHEGAGRPCGIGF